MIYLIYILNSSPRKLYSNKIYDFLLKKISFPNYKLHHDNVNYRTNELLSSVIVTDVHTLVDIKFKSSQSTQYT